MTKVDLINSLVPEIIAVNPITRAVVEGRLIKIPSEAGLITPHDLQNYLLRKKLIGITISDDMEKEDL